MRRLKTVIIGMGRMGKMRYEKLKRHGGFEITGICDATATRKPAIRIGGSA